MVQKHQIPLAGQLSGVNLRARLRRSVVTSPPRCAHVTPRFLVGEVGFPLSASSLGRQEKKNYANVLSSTPLHNLCRLRRGHGLSIALSQAPLYCALLHALVGWRAQRKCSSPPPVLDGGGHDQPQVIPRAAPRLAFL